MRNINTKIFLVKNGGEKETKLDILAKILKTSKLRKVVLKLKILIENNYVLFSTLTSIKFSFHREPENIIN